MNIGTSLRDARKNRLLTQTEVCSKVEISQTFLSQIEAGKKEPSPSMLRRLCKHYKIPPQIIVWKSIEVKDIPKNKRQIFNALSPAIDNLISEFFK